MKNLFKKIGALLVAAVMVLSMCTAAFADAGTDGIIGTADDKGTITVEGVENGVTVSAYPIAPAMYDSINGNFIGYSEIYISKNKIENPSAADLQAAYNQVKDDAGKWFNLTSDGDKYKADNKPVGMYLIKVTGSQTHSYNLAVVSISYVNKKGNNVIDEGSTDMSVKDGVAYVKKSGEPSVEKTITSGNSNTEKTGNSVNIGDTVSYQVTINPVPDYRGAHPVLNVQDTLSKGLDYADKLVVKAQKTTGETATLVKDTDYTVTNPVKDENGKTTIAINFVVGNTYKLNDYAGGIVTITYDATLNSNAEIDNVANNNDVTLRYTKDSNVTGNDGTSTDKTYTYTFDIDGDVTAGILTKKDASNNNPLEGATFTVYDKDKKIYKNSVFTEGTVTSDKNGKLFIKGLAAGTYYLKETIAPEGYSVNTHEFKIVITATYNANGTLATWNVNIDGADKASFTVTNDGVSKNVSGIDIMNTKLSSLPSTGGMGTYLFTIIGVVVMAGAAGAFFISRRKGSEE